MTALAQREPPGLPVQGEKRAGTTELQRLIQARQLDAAVTLAERLLPAIASDSRLALLILLAFERSGAPLRALEIIRSWSGIYPSREIAAIALRVACASGTIDDKMAVATTALASGLETGIVHTTLGLGHATRLQPDRAIHHLERAATFGPLSLRAASILGELLLGKGNARDALPHLRYAAGLAPQMPTVRVLLARAYRMLRDFEAAAEEFRKVSALAPESARWSRAAIAALSQSGHRDEANTLFKALSARREPQLPDDFATGLDQLWQQTDTAQIPQPRLDWAWRLRDPRATVERPDWERRARWGHLADRLILDWLECRYTRAAEVMANLANLDEFAEVTGRLHRRGRGLIIASAHVGAMYAGPMVLELVDYPSKWLASAANLPAAPYRASLISTSDQIESQVARQAMESLGRGDALAIMVDGAMSVAAPRIAFEGQSITYSAFAARIAHRYAAPSIFVVPQWRDGRIALLCRPLPSSDPGEAIEAYLPRWRGAYLAALREAIACEPENLRLGGGLWRHVR